MILLVVVVVVTVWPGFEGTKKGVDKREAPLLLHHHHHCGDPRAL